MSAVSDFTQETLNKVTLVSSVKFVICRVRPKPVDTSL